MHASMRLFVGSIAALAITRTSNATLNHPHPQEGDFVTGTPAAGAAAGPTARTATIQVVDAGATPHTYGAFYVRQVRPLAAYALRPPPLLAPANTGVARPPPPPRGFGPCTWPLHASASSSCIPGGLRSQRSRRRHMRPLRRSACSLRRCVGSSAGRVSWFCWDTICMTASPLPLPAAGARLPPPTHLPPVRLLLLLSCGKQARQPHALRLAPARCELLRGATARVEPSAGQPALEGQLVSVAAAAAAPAATQIGRAHV